MYKNCKQLIKCYHFTRFRIYNFPQYVTFAKITFLTLLLQNIRGSIIDLHYLSIWMKVTFGSLPYNRGWGNWFSYNNCAPKTALCYCKSRLKISPFRFPKSFFCVAVWSPFFAWFSSKNYLFNFIKYAIDADPVTKPSVTVRFLTDRHFQ